mmetsp:Transcript_115552/g.331680  ORF Transcript_115552/g.331680 Transcript_115552/m.331680 type:complete len:213 (+) Transcript_115552:413-1051(+)
MRAASSSTPSSTLGWATTPVRTLSTWTISPASATLAGASTGTAGSSAWTSCCGRRRSPRPRRRSRSRPQGKRRLQPRVFRTKPTAPTVACCGQSCRSRWPPGISVGCIPWGPSTCERRSSCPAPRAAHRRWSSALGTARATRRWTPITQPHRRGFSTARGGVTRRAWPPSWASCPRRPAACRCSEAATALPARKLQRRTQPGATSPTKRCSS